MNNSKIVIDNLEEETDGRESFLKKQQGELTQIVEAIKRIEISPDWQKLKRLVLDDVITNLEHKVSSEASKQEVDVPELYRLQGQLVWAKKYANLSKLAEFFKLQLEGIKKQINEQKNPRDGAL